MRRLVVPLLALVGCKEQNPDFCPANPDDPRCGGTADGGADASGSDGDIDAGPDCFGDGAFEVCPMGNATGSHTLTGSLDTTDSSLCAATQYWKMAGQTPSCFVIAANVAIQNVTVTGSRPLVVIAGNELAVTGHLDAASHIATTTPIEGPGAVSPGTCGTYGNPAAAIPAGGGAGASFVATGGSGANGGKGDNVNAGGTSYTPFLTTPPGALRAGCRGQTGGDGQGAAGTGGFGGGAVYLVAGGTMSLGAAAIVNASGAGAGASGKTAGGGGGGSGGMIILYANDFEITNGAIVVANGGSGSTGGNSAGAGTGTRGNDPDPTNPMTPAPGPTDGGGAGGRGYAVNNAAGPGIDGLAGQGGGGGGGGGGYIQSPQALTNVTASPAVSVVP